MMPGGKDMPVPSRSSWVYVWLFLVPLIGVPWLMLNAFSLPSYASLGRWSAAVLAPALLFLPLLWNIRADDLFRRRHTQQALILAALRIGSTWFWLAATRGEACGGWILTNLILWLGGSTWGLLQVRRGECWLMQRRGEQQDLPRVNRIANEERGQAAATAPPDASADATQTRPLPLLPSEPVSASNLDAQLKRARTLARTGRRGSAVAVLLEVYRNSAGTSRRRAVTELEQLGEIENF